MSEHLGNYTKKNTEVVEANVMHAFAFDKYYHTHTNTHTQKCF
jgi:hypothetical protein